MQAKSSPSEVASPLEAHASHSGDVPPVALFAAGALIAFVLLAILLVRAGPHSSITAAVPVTELHLRFLDRSDGSVEVQDVDVTPSRIEIIPMRSNGFLRGVLRGLARSRRLEHIGTEASFVLTRWTDGRLTLSDPQTGQRIALEVFGPDNWRPFVQLLSDLPGT